MHENANLTFKINESAAILSIILDIQPRVTTSEGGKTGDEIILELIMDLQEKTPDNIDPDDCAKNLFKINNHGLMHCLSTVLSQEIERFNNLLTAMKNSLISLSRAIQGLEIMSEELDYMYGAFLKNRVPPNWEAVAYPSLKPLASWIVDLMKRVEFMRLWCQEGHPKCFWLPGFFFPHGFMTGTLQTHARKHRIAIDLLQFSFKVLKIIEPEEVTKAAEDGIYINGLHLECASWNIEDGVIEDQQVSQSAQGLTVMPIIHFLPKENYKRDEDSYNCPTYKTSVRAGVLSTTGQSTNFVLAIDLPTIHPPEFWTLRGTALLF